MLKFRCDACGQKMGVPEKYAGKRVRCTGCKEPVRVPEPEPELQPVEELDGYDVEPAEDNDPFADALGGLSELDGQSGELQQLQPAPAASGGSCPNCGAGVTPGAVICIQCGNNLQSGGKVKTKVGVDKVGGGGGGGGFGLRQIAAFVVGAIVAGAGGFAWYIVYMIGFEIGLLAWAIGGLTGLSVALIYRRYSIVAGLGAALCTLFGLVVGKGLILMTFASVSFLSQVADELIEEELNDPDVYREVYVEYMLENEMFEPDLQKRWDDMFETDGWDEAVYEDMLAAADARIATLSEEEKRTALEDYYSFNPEGDPEAQEALDMINNVGAVAMTFSLYDFLWIPLALATGFQVGRGKDW